MNFATLAGLFRIIQSVPSKKAEPVKKWLAAVGAERINQMQDPERSLEQAVADYRRLGHSVISSENAIGHITPEDELPLSEGHSLSDDSKETF